MHVLYVGCQLIAQITTVKSHSTILLSSNRKHFQSILKLHLIPSPLGLPFICDETKKQLLNAAVKSSRSNPSAPEASASLGAAVFRMGTAVAANLLELDVHIKKRM